MEKFAFRMKRNYSLIALPLNDYKKLLRNENILRPNLTHELEMFKIKSYDIDVRRMTNIMKVEEILNTILFILTALAMFIV